MIMFQMKISEVICKNLLLEKLFPKNGLRILNLFLIQVVDLLSVDQLVMQVWLVEKLLLILTEDGEDMEGEPSQEKMLQKSIDLLHMLPDGLLRILSEMGSLKELWYKSPIVLVFQNHWVSLLIVTTLLLRDTLIKI